MRFSVLLAMMASLLITGLPASEPLIGTLRTYPAPRPTAGSFKDAAPLGNGFLIAGKDMQIAGQTAGSLALVEGGTVTPLLSTGAMAEVSAADDGSIAALSDTVPEVLWYRAPGGSFTSVDLPTFRKAAVTGVDAIPGGLVAWSSYTAPGSGRLCVAAAWSAATRTWTALEGLNGTVTTHGADGAGHVVAVGKLIMAGNDITFARWNGSAWEALPTPTGTGNSSSYPWSMSVAPGGAIVAANDGAGCFRWEGGIWSTLVPGSIDALGVAATDVDALLVGSDGTISRWVSGTRSELPPLESPGGSIHLAASPAGMVLLGADLGRVNANATSGYLRWNGTTWDDGTDEIRPSAYIPVKLGADGQPWIADRSRVLRYDGTRWQMVVACPWMTEPVDARPVIIKAVPIDGGGWAVLGQDPNSYSNYRAAVWDGTTWGADLSIVCYWSIHLCPISGGVVVGGGFAVGVADGTATNVVRWTGTAWARLGGGTNGAVRGMSVDDLGGVALAGDFSVVDGDLPVPGLARWNNGAWTSLAATAPPRLGDWTPMAILIDNGDLYLAPYVYRMLSTSTVNVYRYRMGTWTLLGEFAYPEWSVDLTKDGAGGILTRGTVRDVDGRITGETPRWNGAAWEPVAQATTGILEGSATKVGGQSPGVLGTTTDGVLTGWLPPLLRITGTAAPEGATRFVTNVTPPVIQGTGVPGTAFTLTTGTGASVDGTVPATGRWSSALPGTWSDGVFSLTLRSSGVMDQSATVTIDSTPPTILRMTRDLSATYMVVHLEVSEPLSKVVPVQAGLQFTRATDQRLDITIPQSIYRQRGATLSLDHAIQDQAGNRLTPLTLFLSWDGLASLTPLPVDTRPFRLLRMDYKYDPLQKFYETTEGWTTVVLTFSHPVILPPATGLPNVADFLLQDTAGITAYGQQREPDATRLTIWIPSTSFQDAGSTIPFGNLLTDDRGQVITGAAIKVAKDGTPTITGVANVQVGDGSGSDGSVSGSSASGASGCGMGSGLALLGLVLVRSRRRSAARSAARP